MQPSRSLKKGVLVAAFSLLLLFAEARPCHATDFDECADDLDSIHSSSDDAADAAREAQDAKDDLESKQSDLEACAGDCEMEHSEYEDAKTELQDKIDSLKDELSTLDSHISSAGISCGYELGPMDASKARLKPSDPCAMYKRYKNRLPVNTLLKICKGTMTEPECSKCLGIGAK